MINKEHIMQEHRLFGLVIALIGIAGLAFWTTSFLDGTFNDMMRGVGVEILGAFVTVLFVMGIERLYAKPDQQIINLAEQLQQQTEKIDSLQDQLRQLLLQRTSEIYRPDILDSSMQSEQNKE